MAAVPMQVRYLLIPGLGLVTALTVVLWAGRKGRPGRPFAVRSPRACLMALGLLGILLFGGLGAARYLTWHSFVYDLGRYDQKVWLVSTQEDPWAMVEQTWRGGVRETPCGIQRSSGVCHFQPLHLIPALLYQTWASPLLLLALQVLAIVSGMIPLYILACGSLGDRTAGLAICLTYLLFPVVQYNALLEFRPEFVAIPSLLWAFLLAHRRHVVIALALAASAGLMKESLLLAFAGFGLYIWVRDGRRVLGLGACGLGLLGFSLIDFGLLAGANASEGKVLLGKYLAGDALATVLRRDKLIFLGTLLGPLAGLPLLSPLPLLAAAPALALLLLSPDLTHPAIHWEYAASAVGPLFVALLDVLPRLPARLGTRVQPIPLLAGLVTLGAFVAFATGPTPLSLNFWSRAEGGHWHYAQYLPDRQAVLNRAEALIPTDPDVVVVTQNDVNSARLAHRHFYHPFPHALDRADYIVLDTQRSPFVYREPNRKDYEEIVALLRADPAFQTIFDEEGVLVFRRSAPGQPAAAFGRDG